MVASVTGFPSRSRLRPHGGPAASRRCEWRRPEKTPLHKVVSENLESWLQWRDGRRFERFAEMGENLPDRPPAPGVAPPLSGYFGYASANGQG